MSNSRLAEHLTRFLGAGAEVEQLARNVKLWRYQRGEFVSFATQGLSDLDVAALKPQELVCSVLLGQDGAAAYLVKAMLDQIIELDRGLLVDQIIPGKTPILDRTNIFGLLATSHPYLDDPFNLVTDAEDTILIQIVTLLPLTEAEVRLGEKAGLDALIDAIEESDPPVLDVTRPSV